MAKLKMIHLIGIVFLLGYNLNAQNHYNIRLNAVEVENPTMACYKIELAAADATDFNLAGQNYRLYYDATKLRYQAQTSESLLPAEKYTALILRDNHLDVNARGAGKLDFDEHLSFINLSNDLKTELEGGVTLPASGTWVETAKICFDIIGNQENATKNSLFWARPALTSEYASAFVEVAEWLEPEVTVPARAAIYFDEEASTSNFEEQWEILPKVYPIPTKDNLTIDYQGREALFIQLYSIDGKLLLEENFVSGSHLKSISLNKFSSGIYQMRISTKNKMLIKKIEIIQ